MRGDPSAGTEPGGGRPAAGWYPDYAAPSGHERYWDGQAWTELTRAAPASAEAPAARRPGSSGAASGRVRSLASRASWRGAAVVVVVLAVLATVVVLAERDPRDPAGDGAAQTVSQPAEAGASADAGEESGGPSGDTGGEPGGRAFEVATVVDPLTLVLAGDVAVRLVGVEDPVGACAPLALEAMQELVQGREVTLVRRGPARDDAGRLLRYVERDGVDVGMRLIQRGLAAASAEPHARGAIYRRVAARATPGC